VTSAELDRRFPTDDACLEYLKERRYPNGTPCPSCKKGSRFHRIAGRSAYSCQYCGHHVYPTANTIFHKSRTSLRLWFRAIELVRTRGDELTARALERELGVGYKTALRMHRQIRGLLEEDPDPLAGGDAARTLMRARPSQGRPRTGNRAVKESRVERASRQPRRRRGGGLCQDTRQRGYRQNSGRHGSCAPRRRDDQRYLACDRVGNRPPRSSSCRSSLSDTSHSNPNGGGCLQQHARDAFSKMAVAALAEVHLTASPKTAQKALDTIRRLAGRIQDGTALARFGPAQTNSKPLELNPR